MLRHEPGFGLALNFGLELGLGFGLSLGFHLQLEFAKYFLRKYFLRFADRVRQFAPKTSAPLTKHPGLYAPTVPAYTESDKH
ncbi:hypothetical protein AYI75_01515 [Shewanella algae]|nr:hypothetical protein AYI88_02040 [Shewanella algae]TWO85834.1 hypothetical protein AYI75_01515 [Shewanella algae]